MKEFFGFGGYQRTAEGYFSWQHLTFVTSLMVIMVICAVILGLKNRKKEYKQKNKVIVFCAVLINVLEIFSIVMTSIRENDPLHILHRLPLFLCTISLIALPLAAFTKGRLKEASLDFVFIFGVLGAVMGTYFAGQNYACYPVLSMDNVFNGVNHAITGFCSLYIAISGMLSMKKKNIGLTFLILTGFCAAAYIADITIPYNYMFLMRGDGTPYDIIYNALGGNPVLYPLSVTALFLLYISAFYFVYYLISKRKNKTAK